MTMRDEDSAEADEWQRRYLLRAVMIVVTSATLLVMAALMGLAIVKLFGGLEKLWLAGTQKDQNAALGAILHGLDLLLLSPVGYMASLGISEYLRNVRNPEARAGITRTKAFIVGLMVAAIMVQLVEKLLLGEASAKDVQKYCLAIAVMGIYGLLIEALVNLDHGAQWRSWR